MTICDKCKWLWCCAGKPYCNALKGNTKYKKGKKECECFEKGDNYKKYMKNSVAGSSWNRKRGR